MGGKPSRDEEKGRAASGPPFTYAQFMLGLEPRVAPAILLRNRIEADVAADVIAEERHRWSLLPEPWLEQVQDREPRLFAGRRVRALLAEDLLGSNEQTDERSSGIHDRSP